MTKGQRRAGTQPLHISSLPIRQCTSLDPLCNQHTSSGGREGEREGGSGQRKKEKEEAALSTASPLHSGIASLSLSPWKKKNKWQKGDKVNKKIVCKITARYSNREWGGGRKGENSPWSSLWFQATWLPAHWRPHFQGLICHMVLPV